LQKKLEARLIESRKATLELRTAPTLQKNKVLLEAARLLEKRKTELLRANRADLEALNSDASSSFRDRLLLNEKRILQMKESLASVVALTDPVDEVVEKRRLRNGLLARRVRAPLGLILMIFESRPNVAIEAFSLGFKAGNAMILRGGKESMRTTAVLYGILEQALRKANLPPAILWGITDPDRKITQDLLQQPRYIDVVIPRGGDDLIRFVTACARMPVIKNDRGLCHVYVHEDADFEMALNIVENSKTQRPGVCNAMETLLVHSKISARFLPKLYERLKDHGVQWFACPKSRKVLGKRSDVHAATKKSWDEEYLDYKMNCKVVASLQSAIEHIEMHGSKHSEAIITRSQKTARYFQHRVDAAAVYWNASTRFTDGFELGLGGELGISTQKLHVRGPVGLRELTSVRWVIDGKGQGRA
jgi:glutamate-5-semialdehyde dehydrogenase